ncbi:hypothetical protein N657DRAFT_631519 [Parathielavia appendiculata]|uniref:Uncharacterized protein n=1 Tax=Parathielavia appendiculata TaxID=2587402 RepID=A0AAN6U798_9PEZI|nr:hypothetical protein N657DRAFT_631519 [Parathielavia appendiculata]
MRNICKSAILKPLLNDYFAYQACDKNERRDRPPSESLAIFKEMKDGTDFGRKHCIRARIALDSPNGAMRNSWLQEKLAQLPRTNLDFARLYFLRTFLSKKKLTKVVDTGIVTGWDDSRMPTVRGLTVPALCGFMLTQGASRNAVTMD